MPTAVSQWLVIPPLGGILLLLLTPMVTVAQLNIDIEKPPFNYTTTTANNRMTRLMAKLESQVIPLEYTQEHGYLRSLLSALEISESSQALVFSKTSMQVKHISRNNPRAIFFNDDTYLGWVRGSSLVEISTTDPQLGAAFYTVEMTPPTTSGEPQAKLQRVNYDCLGCHATSLTQGVPGHTVRSVLPRIDGSVDAQKESFVTDHSSPFSERWGGWYVTGSHGEMKHRGNAFLQGGALDTSDNGNRQNLRAEFDTFGYLSPYSDIVALMVLEHQSQTHNAMTIADFTVRQRLYERSQIDPPPQFNKERPDEEADREWQAELYLIAKEVVQCLLFCNETALPGEVRGSRDYAEHFTSVGPKDRQGRSLREFDMKQRMFQYPCSYLIYSPAFDGLNDELRNQVIVQLRNVLEGRDDSPAYDHLSPEIRNDILEILRDTKPGFELPG